MHALMVPNVSTAFPRTPAPIIEITSTNKVWCTSLECGWVDFADDEMYAMELRRQHTEWHEDGCPRI